MTQSLQDFPQVPSAVRGALDHEAPFLIEKLLKDRVVDAADEAEALFTEVKRYLVLNHVDRTKTWKMYSLRVDEAWHQFVLFTVEYVAFCNRYFGHYVHHAPSNAPDPGFGERAPAATFAEFAERYREMFGSEPALLWDDASSVALQRRVFNDWTGQLRVHPAGEMVDLVGPADGVLFSVNEIAHEALAFVADTGVFYVRELPGDLTDEEKVGLISTLVDMKLLRVG